MTNTHAPLLSLQFFKDFIKRRHCVYFYKVKGLYVSY